MPKAKEELCIYPAVFTYDEDGISVEFPDFSGAIACGENDTEAVYNAKEVLALAVCDYEAEGESLPKATELAAIELKKNQRVFAIDVWMPYYRTKVKDYCVKKTLTIPNSLNVLAEAQHINFSRVLTEALAERLGVADTYR